AKRAMTPRMLRAVLRMGVPFSAGAWIDRMLWPGSPHVNFVVACSHDSSKRTHPTRRAAEHHSCRRGPRATRPADQAPRGAGTVGGAFGPPCRHDRPDRAEPFP